MPVEHQSAVGARKEPRKESAVEDGSPVGLRGLGLGFESTEVEEQYRQQHRRRDLSRATAFVGTLLAACLIFAVSDYRLFGASPQLLWLLAVRAVVFFASVLTLARIYLRPTPRDASWTILFWSVIVVAAGLYIASTRPPNYTGHAIPVVVFLLGSYMMVPLPGVLRAIPACLITGGYGVLCFWVGPTGNELVVTAILTSLVAVNVLGCAVSIQLEQWDRKHFLALRRETELRTLLEQALAEIKTLRGILPICCHCKRVRDDTGYWQQVEVYVRDHTYAEFSHGICPDCMKAHYQEYLQP